MDDQVPASSAPSQQTAAESFRSDTAPPARKTNILAVIALCCAIVGIVTCLPAPIGAVLGHVARRRARARGEHGAGMGLAAIIIGWTGFAAMITLVAAYVALTLWAASQGGTSSDGTSSDGGSHHHNIFDDFLVFPA